MSAYLQQTLDDFSSLEILRYHRPLLVCENWFDWSSTEQPIEVVRFSSFTSNPCHEDAMKGVSVLRENQCDVIVAIGGGSTIDTAKAIKYYSDLDLPLVAVPTTAGTGSEATHFAVIYHNGIKLSLADDRLLPNYVILNARLLNTLPLYQRKCTMLDALCQAIESWWSKKSNEQSKAYSKAAISLILRYYKDYLCNKEEGNINMLRAANLAGKAINITTTTAPHAMSYMLSTLYLIPHGHAVAICLPEVWREMGGFDEIAVMLGASDYIDATAWFESLLTDLDVLPPKGATLEQIERLTESVNLQRLGNNPIEFDRATIKRIYMRILAPNLGS
ncbi:MAG: phosphonoacetaldehyde reductase [Oscillospiraceae bacterium]|nr:phosphonoacetaldehyde reductase [Oscillospiraceae bacterium]